MIVTEFVVLLSIKYAVIAVESAESATPARISVVPGVAPPARATPYTTTTEITAPANAASGSRLSPYADTSASDTITIVAARFAPVATPIRYGSASGFRNTPWYVAPAIASVAPTTPASSTRGSRTSQMMFCHAGDTSSGIPTPGRCDASIRTVASSETFAGPTATATSPIAEQRRTTNHQTAATTSLAPTPPAFRRAGTDRVHPC